MGIGSLLGKTLGFDIGSKLGSTSSNIPLILNDGNTVAWYSYENVIESGGVVSQATDISGNGNNITSSIEDERPSITADGILFDGAGDKLTATFTLDQPEMIYAVLRQKTWTLADRLWDGGSATTMYVNQRGTTPNLGMNTTSATGVNNNNNLALDTFGIIRALYNGSSSFLDIDDNRISGESVAVGDAGGFTLGGTPSGFYANIEVKEVIIRKIADTTENDAIIYNYLKSKHGL